MALRELPIKPFVQGWDRDPAAIAKAIERGAIDHGSAALHEIVRAADVVIVATPVLAVCTVFEAIAPYLKPGAIVSDVASTKVQIVAWAEATLPFHAVFVGGHPMAGGERHGVEHARANLVQGATYCLTPASEVPQAALDTLQAMIAAIGARPLLLSPELHDRYVAAISHLPFLLSAALVQQTARDERWPEMRRLAATGYRDVTRLASGDATMHRDICLTNADAIRPLLHDMARLLNDLADQLDDATVLHEFFRAAQHHRDEWLRERDAPSP